MVANIKFSIILPTYNRGYCICNAINSVIQQTYANIELIIIDDNSEDDTQNIIFTTYEDHIGKDIHYIKLPYKQGVSSCRNHGISIASGSWIGYIDSDNTISPLFYETMYQSIVSNPSYQLFYCKYQTSRGVIKSHPYRKQELLNKNLD